VAEATAFPVPPLHHWVERISHSHPALTAAGEFEKSHFASISENTIKGYWAYLKHLLVFFGDRVLVNLNSKMVEEYRGHRRQQPSIRYMGRTLKGATVNRELEYLTCILDLAVQRKYIPENPARAVKHFNELRERPAKQMLTWTRRTASSMRRLPIFAWVSFCSYKQEEERTAKVFGFVGTKWIGRTASSTSEMT